jgi:phage recombination protein Bet
MNAVVETKLVQLPEPVARRSITEAQWRTLVNLYPGAKSESILLVWDYCRARKLDPLKKPCHIVPMRVKDARTGDYEWRDIVLPGIYEVRTTATRTGLYLGHSRPEYGPEIEYAGTKAPEWCDLTVYKWNVEAKMRCEFPVHTLFREVVATNKEGRANDRWNRAPLQMLTKCAEAAGLREAFPDELGGEQTAEEMEGRVIDVTPHDEPTISEEQKDTIEKFVAEVRDVLEQDVEETLHADMLFAIHQRVCADDTLYPAIKKALVAHKVIKSGAVWNNWIALGSKQFQARNAAEARK